LEKINWGLTHQLESMAFLIYYSPIILQGRLQEKYYTHLMKLVIGYKILLMPNSKDTAKVRNNLFLQFYKDCSKLYGSFCCTMNIHNLQHWEAFAFCCLLLEQNK